MIIKHCRKQIIRRTDSVKIAREMEIDILHRNNLGISAACRTALDSEDGTERRLTQSNSRILADSSQAVSKTDCCGGFSLARRGGRDGGHKYKLAVLSVGFAEQRKVDFRLMIAVLLNVFFVNMSNRCNLLYMLHLAILCNFNVCQICHNAPPVLLVSVLRYCLISRRPLSGQQRTARFHMYPACFHQGLSACRHACRHRCGSLRRESEQALCRQYPS